MKRFEEKNVLLTGGTSGIGLATARRIAAEGGRVCIVARHQATIDDAVKSLEGSGHFGLTCDLTSAEEAERNVKEAAAKMGPLHCAILCAGAHAVAPLAVAKDKHFREMYDANVTTVVNTVRPFIKAADTAGGSIVILGSAAALRGNPGVVAYSTAKGALVSLCKTLALELAAKRVRVNIVLPGVVATAMTDRFFEKLSEAQKAAIIFAHPLGIGNADDVAAVNAFLASDEARWMTGAEVVVDGGLTIR